MDKVKSSIGPVRQANLDKLLGLIKSVRDGSDGYQRLYKSENKALFNELRQQGFFNLFVTNRGVLVSVHQVVWFSLYGKDWLAKGLEIREGERSCHHLDSNPRNNSPENIVMVTNWEHQVIETSKNQVMKDKSGRKFAFLGKHIDTSVQPRKNNGDIVVGIEHRLVELILITRQRSVEVILNSVTEGPVRLTGGWVTMPQEILRFFFEKGIKAARQACKQIVWQQFSWQPVMSFAS